MEDQLRRGMGMDDKIILQRLSQHVAVAAALRDDAPLRAAILSLAQAVVEAYLKGGKVIFLGNGGSAAEAQHMAAELLGRFYLDRKALPALALTANSSNLTAIGNDFGYDQVFSRQLEAWARPGDVVVALSTSGNSPNVVEALKYARAHRVFCAALTGSKRCKMDGAADLVLKMPSDDTPRIQEMHQLVLHTVCEMVEAELAARKKI